MILPVKAPAAAPAAAPIDAARMWPVAAPPIIAPVAAPQAAPWPTGVSQELKIRQPSEIPEMLRRTLVFIESHLISNEPRTDVILTRQFGHTVGAVKLLWMCGDL